MTIMKVFVLIAFFTLCNSKTSFMPNLPLGEYRMIYEKIYPCESKSLIHYNIYLNKKSLSESEVKGNYTFLVPLDDTLTIDLNAASWGSIGGWKPNSMVYITKNACSNARKLLGNAWNKILKAFNFPNTSCPVVTGTYYTTTGLDLKELSDNNLPKVYFYGKYKATIKIKNVGNEVIGCSVMEISLIRPWETSI
uniref:MD-2-related lipid-recognition domain-containing protein n=1 Tax=Schizaphis graminum TaxID=13262 RepID=A0A2S2PSU7_SCHGA